MGAVKELVDLDVLRVWMDSQGLGHGPIGNAYPLTGGTQNILIQFTRDNRSYVLRRPPIHLRKNSNKTMQREAQVLAALAGSDVPHPGFIAACSATDVLGASFYLMEPVNGFNLANGLPDLHGSSPDIKRRMGLSHMDALTKLGEIDHIAVGLQDFGKTEGYLKRQVPRWLGQLESYKKVDTWPGIDKSADVNSITNWLDDHCPKSFSPGIIHGDAHLANVMFAHDSGEIMALVDWELATVGDPLIDLGWIMATWPDPNHIETLPLGGIDYSGFPTLDELINRYSKNSTRSVENITWYGVMGCFKLAVILEGTYVRYCAGKAPKKVAEMLHMVSQNALKRAHELIS